MSVCCSVRCDKQAASGLVNSLQQGSKRCRKVICRYALSVDKLRDMIKTYRDCRGIAVSDGAAGSHRELRGRLRAWCGTVSEQQPVTPRLSHLLGAPGTLPGLSRSVGSCCCTMLPAPSAKCC